MTQPDQSDVTIGELSRGLSRVERQVQDGFAAIRQEIAGLGFVPTAVYAADMAALRDRQLRVELGLADEIAQRHTAEATTQQRAWQAKWSIILAVASVPLSVIGALIVTGLK